MLYQFIFCVLLPLVVCHTPCCIDRQFTAILSDSGEVAKGNYKFMQIFEDFDAKLLATETYKFVPFNSSILQSRVIQDFNKKKQYDIYNGICTVKELLYDLQGPCVPDDAEILGYSYMGYQHNAINITGYKWKFGDQDVNIVMIFSDECIPLVESISGSFGKDPIDATYTFSNYQKVIQDRSVFNVPSFCTTSIHSDVKIISNSP